MRVVFDIEATGLLNYESVDYTTYPYELLDTFKVHCIVFKDIDTGEIYKFYQDTLEDVVEFLKGVSSIAGHNIINYDLPVMKMYFGVDYEIDCYNEDTYTLFGKPIKIVDTMVLSKLLSPDRLGGHSLKQWGLRLGLLKGAYGEETEKAWEEFSLPMLDYCVQDVEVTHKLLLKLLKDMSGWPWGAALELEQCVAHITQSQEQRGFKFDSELAQWCFEDLKAKMRAIEEEVEPHLPPKSATKKFLKEVTPPKRLFKKDGEPTADLLKFCTKYEGEVKGEGSDRVLYMFGKEFSFPLSGEPLKSTEPMYLSDQIALKKYLVSLGWKPQVYTEGDLTLDSKKRKHSTEKFKEARERYIEDTIGSPFEKDRFEFIKCRNKKEFLDKLMNHDLSRPLKVCKNPKFTVDQDKTIDPNLDLIKNKFDFVEDIVHWLTYRHRKNSILSLAEDSATKKTDTGWLACKRLDIDGRVPTPADTLGAVTARYTHKFVANIPRCTSLYGDYMRALFGVDDEHYQVGMDADALEAKIEGHHVYKYPKGKAYVEQLLSPKPNDDHQQRADKIGISRDDAKKLKYSSSYGAQPPKIARDFGWTLPKAKKIFSNYWEDAKPLAMYKEDLSREWEKNNKEFIRAIDGRKLYSRSQHSLVNLRFQSSGVICMKRAMCWFHHESKEEKLLVNQLIAYHDEQQNEVPKKEVKFKLFKTKEEATKWKVEQENNTGKIWSDVSEVNGNVYLAYSRAGELSSKSLQHASEYYKLNLPLTGGYVVGRNWKECH